VKAHARLVAECVAGRTVLRELRSMAPLTLFPKRRGREAVVHLVNSATSPLGGDELTLTVRVGRGARLRLSGVAATLALPGHRPGGSRFEVHVEVEGTLEYLPEPTVITARARHTAEFHAEVAADARLRTREVLVLGRSGEESGILRTTQRIVRDGVPVLHQTLDVGALNRSLAHLASRRVLATEVLIDGATVSPAGGDWWSLTPLPQGGSLITALSPDAITADHDLAGARTLHPWAVRTGL